jgi:hypothetical protein
MPDKSIPERVADCEETEKGLLTDNDNHSRQLRDLNDDVEALIQILGLFRASPYVQPPPGILPEIKQKLDAAIAEMRKRHPDLKPFDV